MLHRAWQYNWCALNKFSERCIEMEVFSTWQCCGCVCRLHDITALFVHIALKVRPVAMWCIWAGSRNCSCLVTWFCYQLIAKPGKKTAAVQLPDPYDIMSCDINCRGAAHGFKTASLYIMQESASFVWCITSYYRGITWGFWCLQLLDTWWVIHGTLRLATK